MKLNFFTLLFKEKVVSGTKNKKIQKKINFNFINSFQQRVLVFPLYESSSFLLCFSVEFEKKKGKEQKEKWFKMSEASKNADLLVLAPAPAPANAIGQKKGAMPMPRSENSDSIKKESKSLSSKNKKLGMALKHLTRKTWILWVSAIVVLVVGIVCIVIGIVFWVRSNNVAVQVLESPTEGLTTGFILYSNNTEYFLTFGTDLMLFLQGARPSHLQNQGELLWSAYVLAPTGSVVNFLEDGSLEIRNEEIVIWTNETELIPLSSRPPGPYILYITDDGHLTIATKKDKEIIWSRPEEKSIKLTVSKTK